MSSLPTNLGPLLYLLGTLTLLAVGITAFVRAKGSPFPGAVRTAGALLTAAALVQVASSVVYFVVGATGSSFEAVMTATGLTNVIVELLYGLTVTGALVVLAAALVRSKSADAHAAGPAAPGHPAGHAFAPPAPGQPYGYGQAYPAPPEHDRPGYGYPHPGGGAAGHPGPEGHQPPSGEPGGGTGWGPGDSGGFGGGGSSSDGGGGSSSVDGGGGGGGGV
ncbi:hypothetical protein KGD83_27495 [Nocardiopsis akebiae]|uniref:Uncharacterized protein n=1 Tax=Nocardiopsis akebiae TaxID=2831968 RepID=A0ABX8C3C7_9ACTN|nr:hypothetical protein [Nocardiopsis akebiae]QUX28892.1 hypothetical protein KGD83_27495 [Nocardiopsis akebiae]